MKRYSGLVLVRVEFDAEDENAFRAYAGWILARMLRDIEATVEQVSSVTCLAAPPRGDGTDGPTKTITDKLEGGDDT